MNILPSSGVALVGSPLTPVVGSSFFAGDSFTGSGHYRKSQGYRSADEPASDSWFASGLAPIAIFAPTDHLASQIKARACESPKTGLLARTPCKSAREQYRRRLTNDSTAHRGNLVTLNRRDFVSTAGWSLFASAASQSVAHKDATASSAANTSDWSAVRGQFDLSPDWLHFSQFYLVSHPRPVREAIERYRRMLDANPFATVEHGMGFEALGPDMNGSSKS
jgi:hypothetical protein